MSNRYIPESLRWLVVAGKYERAQQVLLHVCEINKSQLPDNIDIKEFEDLVSEMDKILPQYRTGKSTEIVLTRPI